MVPLIPYRGCAGMGTYSRNYVVVSVCNILIGHKKNVKFSYLAVSFKAKAT